MPRLYPPRSYPPRGPPDSCGRDRPGNGVHARVLRYRRFPSLFRARDPQLTTTWELPWPDVLISIIGEYDRPLSMHNDAREALELGLLDAIRATNAWVLTGGLDSGVMCVPPTLEGQSGLTRAARLNVSPRHVL